MSAFDLAVVIPLYRAAGYLPGLLDRLAAQTFALHRFEVVLVDDLSPDDTRAVAHELQKASPLNLQLLWRNENGGVSAARNTGWQSARAPLILFIDQDCQPDPALLEAHYRAHQEQTEKAAILGRIVWSPEYKENQASEYYKAGYFPSWDTFEPDGHNFPLFITSNASVSKAGLQQIGGFDERFRHNYEDIACGYRLESEAGYRMVLCHQALVYHHRPLPIEEMFRRNFVAGREMARLFLHYPALVGHPITLNPAQSLDWGYRLATLESLLAETLDQLPASELAALLPLTDYTGQYLMEHPDLPDNADALYRATLLAQRRYQRELERVRWLEISYQRPATSGQLLPILGKFRALGRKVRRLKQDEVTLAELEKLLSQSLPPSEEGELSYTVQTSQLARRLLEYRERAGRLAHLEKQAPHIARLLADTRRPVAPGSLHLLYDTLKEYPLSRGMAQGLADFFDIKSYSALKERPLFAGLYARWQAERAAYLRSQQERVQAGQAELSDYARQIEATLASRKA